MKAEGGSCARTGALRALLFVRALGPFPVSRPCPSPRGNGRRRSKVWVPSCWSVTRLGRLSLWPLPLRDRPASWRSWPRAGSRPIPSPSRGWSPPSGTVPASPALPTSGWCFPGTPDCSGRASTGRGTALGPSATRLPCFAGTPAAYWARARAAVNADLTEVLPAIEVPTLVLSPEDDRLIDPRAGAPLRRIPRARCRTLPRTGHMFRFSHPTAYGEAVEAFLREAVDDGGGPACPASVWRACRPA
jgi:pimeloyl-ACP methyl ester carboxylesterase